MVNGDELEEIGKLRVYLGNEFEIKDLGSLRYFLRIEVARSKQGLFISHKNMYLISLRRQVS